MLRRVFASLSLVAGMACAAVAGDVPPGTEPSPPPSGPPGREAPADAGESASSLGIDNALGDVRSSRRVTKIYGGSVKVKEPTIAIPTVQTPHVAQPQAPLPVAPQLPQAPDVAFASSGGTAAIPDERGWKQLEPGLEYGEFSFIAARYERPTGEERPPRATLRVVRIDPARFEFVLCAASDGGVPLPLGRWADRMGLVAAINASMYLPDGRTSTGYLREGPHVNNARHGERLGAYFLAGPDGLARAAGVPTAAVEDGTRVDIEALEGHYRLVAQNFRIISEDRRIVWAADNRPVAVAAVAQTGDGHILFLHCRQPVEPYVLAQRLLNLPLDVRTVMYVEGGAQAGLLLRSGGLLFERYGRSAAAILLGDPPAPSLPNVLGIRRRQVVEK